MDRYHEPPAWESMMRNAMAKDFSWARSAERYHVIYRRVLANPPVA
jgi:glycogen synthase